MPPVDILTPFYNAEKNRKERFLVEYDSYIINRSANLVYAMLQNIVEYQDRYPLIHLFIGMNAREIYEATKFYDPFELLVSLAQKEKATDTPPEEYRQMMEDFKTLEKVDNHKYTITTMFSYALGRIIKEKCCEKAYIVKSYPYTDWELDMMKEIYKPLGEAIEFIEAKVIDFYEAERKSLTTIFLNHLSDLMKISINPGHAEYTDKQLFVLRASNEIIEIDKETKSINYTCGELFEELEKDKIHTSVIQCNVFRDELGLNDRPMVAG